MSDNRDIAGERPLLVTEEEFTERMGNVSADTVFMTALAMLLQARGGRFTFTDAEFQRFKALHGHMGQLGISVHRDTVNVFLLEEPVAEA